MFMIKLAKIPKAKMQVLQSSKGTQFFVLSFSQNTASSARQYVLSVPVD